MLSPSAQSSKYEGLNVVKCSECGYLAVRDREGNVIEVVGRVRETGGFGGDKGHADFFCIQRSDAFSLLPPRGDGHERATCIRQERDCLVYCRWMEGYSPKEHVEIMLHKVLLDHQAELDRKRDERERNWRKEDVDLAKRALKVNVWAIVAAFWGGIIAAVIGAWVAYLLTRPVT